jgi:hypothetical protein
MSFRKAKLTMAQWEKFEIKPEISDGEVVEALAQFLVSVIRDDMQNQISEEEKSDRPQKK